MCFDINVNAVFHISKRTLTSVDKKLGRWGDEKVFDVAGATGIRSTRRSDRRSDHERIPGDSDDGPGLG
jgi:hypothetical protein